MYKYSIFRELIYILFLHTYSYDSENLGAQRFC